MLHCCLEGLCSCLLSARTGFSLSVFIQTVYIRNWKEQALQILTDYQRAMEGLNSRRITDHRILAPGLCLTVYDDGTQVYVNYNTADSTAGQTVVPARSYLVVRGDQ